MLSYTLKCKKNTARKNIKVARIQNRRKMLLSKCTVRDSKKSKFIKQKETSILLSNLGIEKPLSNIPFVRPL